MHRGAEFSFFYCPHRPGAKYLEETMSTLRYADKAKNIVNTVKVNEDPFARTVRRLEEEVCSSNTNSKNDLGQVAQKEVQ